MEVDELRGNPLECNLTPINKNYNHQAMIDQLITRYGFSQLGEGSFGVALATENCVVKVVKNVNRCGELEKERAVYQKIKANPKSDTFFAKFPKYHLYNQLESFCHFNMQKIWSPLSGYGDLYDDEAGYGHGFVAYNQEGTVGLVEEGKLMEMDQSNIYPIDRPGNLLHFYVNHFDSDLKEKLDNDQGILLGKAQLEKMFTQNIVELYTAAIGELLSFLIFDLFVIPNDIEVVLGTASKEDRVVRPYILDFNECDSFTDFSENNIERIARSMYNKNGRFYFPNSGNQFFPFFYEGFTKDINPIRREIKIKVLTKYSFLFTQ